MTQTHTDLLEESLHQRIEERDALIRMLIWAREEARDLGGMKSSDHLTRAIDCLRHEI